MIMAESDFRAKLVNTALAYVGTSEPTGDDQFIRWYNNQTNSNFNVNTTPWCCIFASYVINKAGVDVSAFKPFASCSWAVENVFKPANQWHPKSSGYNPIPGDLVFFDWTIDKQPDHVGIVQKVANNKLFTIEGNTKGGCTVDGVRNKSYLIYSDLILGYASPNYTLQGIVDIPSTTNTNDGPIAKTITEVKVPDITKIKSEIPVVQNKPSKYIMAFQKWLNANHSNNLAVDGEFGPKTKLAAVKAWQTQMNKLYNSNLKVDGEFGPISAKAAKSIAKGTKNSLVYILQGMLYCRDYNPHGFSGSFTALTQSAVKDLQKDNGITITGTCDSDTWALLFK